MGTLTRDQAVADARSVAGAAAALVRVARRGADVGEAIDRLELQATQAVEAPTAHFEAGTADEPSDEDLLAGALSQLGIGVTMISAEAAVEDTAQTGRLDDAATALEGTATAIEMAGAAKPITVGFDARPGGIPLSVSDAALAALDEMATTASDAVGAVVDKALEPFLDKVPASIKSSLDELAIDVPGRLARWGLRAVRKGLDLLLRIVDIDAIERFRDQVNDVLTKLGQGRDPAVIAGWAIGVENVRGTLASSLEIADDDARGRLVDVMNDLVERFGGLCKLLRRIAVVIAGLAGALALLHITLAHSLAVTTIELALVVGTLIVLGRDYTGATDLPGRVRGIRLLAHEGGDADT